MRKILSEITAIMASVKRGETKVVSDELRQIISKMIAVVVSIGIVIIAIVVVSALSQDTQYTKDYNSSRNKTWEQMTPGEKDVTRDEIEWRVKKSGLYD